MRWPGSGLAGDHLKPAVGSGSAETVHVADLVVGLAVVVGDDQPDRVRSRQANDVVTVAAFTSPVAPPSL